MEIRVKTGILMITTGTTLERAFTTALLNSGKKYRNGAKIN
jgi:hypothetical protein